MDKWIGWVLLAMFLGLVIGSNLMCADLSPQHAEFLRVFFIEFPKALVKAWFSILF